MTTEYRRGVKSAVSALRKMAEAKHLNPSNKAVLEDAASAIESAFHIVYGEAA